MYILSGYICVTMTVSQHRVTQLAPIKQVALLVCNKALMSTCPSAPCSAHGNYVVKVGFPWDGHERINGPTEVRLILGSSCCDPASSRVFRDFSGRCRSISSMNVFWKQGSLFLLSYKELCLYVFMTLKSHTVKHRIALSVSKEWHNQHRVVQSVKVESL